MLEVYTREYAPEPGGITGSQHQPRATSHQRRATSRHQRRTPSPQPRVPSSQPRVPSPQPPLLDFRNISVTRGATTVLHNITLRIHAGEHAAILGPNGCGKSTLIKTITRECYPLARPESSLTILGHDTWNVFELRTMLGIVSNDLMSTCTRDITGLEVVLSGFFSSIGIQPYHHITPAQLEKSHQVLDLLEVPHLADRFMTEMSSGEGRRILIARAMVHHPLALLLDEPSNSLDVSATLELRALLRKLAQSGIGILIVTHHLPDIIPEIDRVILLKAGRIFADGTKSDLLTTERLGELFGVPVEMGRRDGYYHLW
jgi:iron complex transport system ATP-binding protein